MNTGNDLSLSTSFLGGQSEVMAMIARQRPQQLIWEKLISWAEKLAEGSVRFAVFAASDAAVGTLKHLSGENFPGNFLEIWRTISAEEITSEFSKTEIFISNIIFTGDQCSATWHRHRKHSAGEDFRSCWIFPIEKDSVPRTWLVVCLPDSEFPSSFQQELIKLMISIGEIVAQPKESSDGNLTELVSHSTLRDVIQHAPVAIAVFSGRELVTELVNDFYLAMVGKNREEFIGRSLLDTIPGTRETVQPLTNILFDTGQGFSVNEIEVSIERNGKIEQCFFNTTDNPIFDENGKVTAIIVVAHEVTELVEARRTTERKEQNIRSMIESAPFPIGVYVGREMRIQFVNRAIMDVWGKGYDIAGKTYAEVLPELESQHIYEQLDKVYTTGIPFHAKNQRVDITANGVLQPFYFNYSFTPLYDSSGNIYGVMNTAADVSELVKAYNRLEESEARARLAIEASEQGTFHFNLLTGQLSASKRMAEIFDVSGTANREEYLAAIIREDLPVREKAFKRAEATGTLAYDVRIRRKDGKISWVRIKGKIYFDEGHPQKLVGVVQDITDQKHFAGLLEQKVEERTTELAELNKKLVSMNDELQQFAYIASHDMQEPLRKIRVFSDILAKQTEKGSQTGRYIDKINLAAERMTGLIHGLLEYSRTSDIRLRYEMVDLNIVLKNVLSDFELLISQKEAEVRVEDLPAIVAVPLQMNQLFYNLVGNSLKFTQDGVKPFIHISFFAINEEIMASLPELDRQREYVGISIADNGTGFDQIYASKIFTVFQRLNERDKFGGYGIGLALCKKVVEEHQGLISATSEAGRGARFKVILPRMQGSFQP